ncbi:MAG: hypothetical protein IJH79_02675 [Lentisphaeria bacterium]|nr:hypothetical protein [Lentisphaeria bacterium]MBQ7206735.1 hypothetical protein [Lentisphaeria bacterium]
MRFSIGWNPQYTEALTASVLRHREQTAEVYFSLPGMPSGRGIMGPKDKKSCNEMESVLFGDLSVLHENGIALNLLVNGNCFGKDALSRSFYQQIGDTVDCLRNDYGLKVVTTTSPLAAKFLKRNFPGLDCRASVNMEIGTPEGMDYVSEYFDSFYLKREYNRDRRWIVKMRRWADDHGKKMYALANSGCLNFCSARTFHDNLVAHEHEIRQKTNAFDFYGICKLWLKREEKRELFLQNSNFIRPEDTGLYEGLFDGMKLATRIHHNPAAVTEAYFSGQWRGNLLDLLEPDHAESFHPVILDSRLMPENFGQTVLNCRNDCDCCTYCREVLHKMTVNVGE